MLTVYNFFNILFKKLRLIFFKRIGNLLINYLKKVNQSFKKCYQMCTEKELTTYLKMFNLCLKNVLLDTCSTFFENRKRNKESGAKQRKKKRKNIKNHEKK